MEQAILEADLPYATYLQVHIVLAEDMSLKEAHDIGEPLQRKLESMELVERAFVHIDYESEHAPETEHKVH